VLTLCMCCCLCVQCFNPLGVGNWSLPSTFTTAPSVPSQPDPPQLVQCTAVSNSAAPALLPVAQGAGFCCAQTFLLRDQALSDCVTRIRCLLQATSQDHCAACDTAGLLSRAASQQVRAFVPAVGNWGRVN
jgi:hypothetical protein